MLVPIDEEEAETDQLVEIVLVVEPLPAAAAAGILLASSLSSLSPFATSSQAPSTTLLLLVMELGGLVTCWFNCAELVCLLLIKLGHTCTSMGFPRTPHGESNPFRI